MGLIALGIIPARGGSKGVPKKNVRNLAGKPLIAWSIETALQCKVLDRIVVTTDDSEISSISRKYGAEVPFSRPAEFAGDDTPDFPVCKHAIDWLAENDQYFPDIVVWLRPTSPLRSVQDISAAVELLIKTRADSVRSVCHSEHHPFWMKRIGESNRLAPFVDGCDETLYYRRQLLPRIYRLNGAVDVTWRKMVMHGPILFSGDVRGYIMPPERSIDLDSEMDFSIAELFLLRMQPTSQI
jgi:CMP-N,N'-diacetyllegionaminic acid synthase